MAWLPPSELASGSLRRSQHGGGKRNNAAFNADVLLFLLPSRSFPLTTMTAQFLHAHSSRPQPQRYTLVFRDGQLLRHQDEFSLVQYRSDARLAAVRPEASGVSAAA